MANPEPLLTYLMPLSAGLSWITLMTTASNGFWKFPVACFGSLWALVNIITRRTMDLGFFTMGMVAASAYLENISGPTVNLFTVQLIGCFLIAANFSLPIVFWPKLRAMFAKTKTPFWLTVFYYYCATSSVFWMVGGYTIYNDPKYSS